MNEPEQNPIKAHRAAVGVAVGIRGKDGRWLMIRRSANVRIAPLKVCFPGGMMESGEQESEAVVREMQEELGIRVRPIRRVWEWKFPDRALMLYGWLAELPAEASDGEQLKPCAVEIAEVLWLSAEEGGRHPDGLATNVFFIAALEAAIESRELGVV